MMVTRISETTWSNKACVPCGQKVVVIEADPQRTFYNSAGLTKLIEAPGITYQVKPLSVILNVPEEHLIYVTDPSIQLFNKPFVHNQVIYGYTAI